MTNLKVLPFEFTAFVKSENLKRETFGPDDEKDLFANIIKDVSHYRPRKISINEFTSFSSIEKEKQISSKFDNIELNAVSSESTFINSNQIRKESNLSNMANASDSRKGSNFYAKNKFDLVDSITNLNNTIIPGKRNKSYSIQNTFGFNYANKNQNKDINYQVPLNKDYKLAEDNSSKINY